MLEPDVGGWMDGWMGIGPRKTDRIPIGKQLFVCDFMIKRTPSANSTKTGAGQLTFGGIDSAHYTG